MEIPLSAAVRIRLADAENLLELARSPRPRDESASLLRAAISAGHAGFSGAILELHRLILPARPPAGSALAAYNELCYEGNVRARMWHLAELRNACEHPSGFHRFADLQPPLIEVIAHEHDDLKRDIERLTDVHTRRTRRTGGRP